MSPEVQDVRLLVGSAWIDAGSTVDPDGTPSDLGAFGGVDAPAGFDDGYRTDTDGDGLFDLWETAHGTNPWDPDANRDDDLDGLDAAAELSHDTDPNDADSDHDGVGDGAEIDGGFDPSSPADQVPVADAGAPVWALAGEPVSVGSTGSSDPNDDTLTFRWTVLSVPAGSTVTAVSDDDAEITTFLPDIEGPYTLELTVSDGAATSSHQVVVNAFDAWIVPDDAPTVADAAAMASDGDAIAVRPGTYTGPVYLAVNSLVLFGLGKAG
jgi:hypothetical protein